MREAVGGCQRQVERCRIGDAGPVEIRRLDALLLGEQPDLRRRAVHHHDPDATEQGTSSISVALVTCRVHEVKVFPGLRDVVQDVHRSVSFVLARAIYVPASGELPEVWSSTGGVPLRTTSGGSEVS